MRRISLLAAVVLCAAPLLLMAGGSDESASGGDAAAAAVQSSDRVRLPIGQYNMDEYVRQTGAEITFSESPFLAGKGLPPVEERLPENPVVMETWMEDGKYGGTLTWTEYTIDYDHYLRHLNAVNLLEIVPSASNHRYNFVGAEIQPSILERWEQNDAADEFTFTIRKGLRWSDGVPVTTEDVRYTFEDNYFNEEITPNLASWAQWGGEPVKLSIVDDYTFSVSFAKPYGLFVSEVTGWAAGRFMRPAHYMKQFHTDYTDIKEIEGIMKEQGYAAEEWGKFYKLLRRGRRRRFLSYPDPLPERHRGAIPASLARDRRTQPERVHPGAQPLLLQDRPDRQAAPLHRPRPPHLRHRPGGDDRQDRGGRDRPAVPVHPPRRLPAVQDQRGERRLPHHGAAGLAGPTPDLLCLADARGRGVRRDRAGQALPAGGCRWRSTVPR